MSVKNHCDLCDAVVIGDGTKVEVSLEAKDKQVTVILKGFVPVVFKNCVGNHSAGIICMPCIDRLFINGKPEIGFPHRELIRSLNESAEGAGK